MPDDTSALVNGPIFDMLDEGHFPYYTDKKGKEIPEDDLHCRADGESWPCRAVRGARIEARKNRDKMPKREPSRMLFLPAKVPSTA